MNMKIQDRNKIWKPLMTCIAMVFVLLSAIFFMQESAIAEETEVNKNAPLIAVIDTGITEAVEVEEAVSVVDDDPYTINTHGANVINYIYGENPDARILSIKVFPTDVATGENGKGYDVAKAIRYAIEHHADIINMSIYGTANEQNACVKEAVEEALKKGIIVVAAAGDGGAPAEYFYPAGIPGVITIGTIDSENKLTSNSNYGPEIKYGVEAIRTSYAAGIFTGYISVHGIENVGLRFVSGPFEQTSMLTYSDISSVDYGDDFFTAYSHTTTFNIKVANNDKYHNVWSYKLEGDGSTFGQSTNHGKVTYPTNLRGKNGIPNNGITYGYMIYGPKPSIQIGGTIYTGDGSKWGDFAPETPTSQNPSSAGTWNVYDWPYESVRLITYYYANTSPQISSHYRYLDITYNNDDYHYSVKSTTSKITFSVKFNANGGSGTMTNQSFTYDTAKKLSANKFTRTGYTFQGWATSDTGAKTYNDEQSVSNLTTTNGGTVNLYAVWKANTSKVTLNKNGGTTDGTKEVTATYGSAMPSATMPTRTGYSFAGYYDTSAATGGTQYYTAAGESARSWNKTGAQTLYARWTQNVYKITLNNANATTDGTSEYYEKYATGKYTTNACTTSISTITIPQRRYTVTFDANGGNNSVPTRTSVYTFGGYYSGSTQYINGSGSITAGDSAFSADTTLSASWTGGGVTLPTPTRVGYTFAGWYTAKTGGTRRGGAGDSYSPTSAETLYAQWTPIVYTITLDNANATTNGTTAYYEKYNTGNYTTSQCTTAISTITKPKREYLITYNGNNGTPTVNSVTAAYTFNGYAKNGTTYINSAGTVTAANNAFVENTTLNAQWTGGSVSLTNATRTGYTFTGWYTAATGGTLVGAAGASYTPTAATTLYAHWTPNEYTVTLDADFTDGTNTNRGTPEIYQTYDTKYSLTSGGAAMTATTNKITVPVRRYQVTYDTQSGYLPTTASPQVIASYSFGGYYTNKNGAGDQYISSTGYITATGLSNTNHFAADGSLYAKWTEGSVTTPIPRRAGYIFKGWNTAANGSGTTINGGNDYTPVEDKTLYAQWEMATYQIRFHANNDADTVTTQTLQRDLPIALDENPFTWEKHTFVGWSTSPNGNVMYRDKSAVTNLAELNGTTDLYAIWQDDTDIIFVDEDTGKAPEISLTDENDGRFLIVEDKSTPGYIMDGTKAEITDLNTKTDPGTFKLRYDDNANSQSKEIVENGTEYLVNVPFENDPNQYTVTKIDENGDPIFFVDEYGENVSDKAAQFEFWVEPLPEDTGTVIDNNTVIATVTDEQVTRSVVNGSVTRTETSEAAVKNHGTVTVDSTGRIQLMRLRPGTWHFKETKAPDGYTLNPVTYNFTVDINGYIGGKSKTGEVSVVNTQSGLFVTKLDNGGLPVPGIRFEVRRNSKTVTPTIYTTDENGYINLSNIVNAAANNTTFWINESAASSQTALPEGMIVTDTTQHQVVVTKADGKTYVKIDGGTADVLGVMTIYNDTNSVKVKKVTEDDEPLEGAEFRIWNGSTVFENVKTDATGFTNPIYGLQSGVWHVVETKAPTGYVLDTTEYTFEVDATTHMIAGLKDYVVTVHNGANRLSIKKVDALTGDPIQGITFLLENSATGLSEAKITGTNGLATWNNLQDGQYDIIENNTVGGYILDETAYSINVKNGHLFLNDGTEVTDAEYAIEITNEQPRLKLTKLDTQHPDIRIENVQFVLDEGTVNEATYTTDENGEFIVAALGAGTHTLKETVPGIYTVDGEEFTYQLDDTVYTFTVNENGTIVCESPFSYNKNERTIEVTLTNDRQLNSTQIIIEKRDQLSGEVLEGAEFTLYEVVDDGRPLSEHVIAQKQTDEDGIVIFDGLYPGNYRVVETKAPSGHYLKTGWEQDFEITRAMCESK